MSCFEGLEMGLNLEVLRPEVDALQRRISSSSNFQHLCLFGFSCRILCAEMSMQTAWSKMLGTSATNCGRAPTPSQATPKLQDLYYWWHVFIAKNPGKFEAIFIALLFPEPLFVPRVLDPERLFVSGVSDYVHESCMSPGVSFISWVPYSGLQKTKQ